MGKMKNSKLRILVFDVETAPILGYVWGLWENNLSLAQIKSDWHLLAWSAKWFKGRDGTVYGPHDKIMYLDQRNAKDIADDKKLLQGIWKLLDEADVVITQNGRAFDIKKLNARFIMNGFQPPSSFKHIDTKQIASSKFGFTSNKLEYMTDKLCTKYKKSKHAKFSGFDLWLQCLAGNKEAWNEMEKYNKYDVLSLEELYLKLQPWDNAVNFNLYHERTENKCNCGSQKFKRNGYDYTAVGKYQRYKCLECGSEVRSRENEFDKKKRASLRVRTR